MKNKTILIYFIVPIVLCCALISISFKIESIEFLIGLAIFTISLSIINTIFFVVGYFKKHKLGLKILPITSGFLLWLISTIVFLWINNNQSLEDEISDKLETFNSNNGHYPYCQSSSALFDSLSINLNYFSPEEYKYEFNKKDNSCIFKYLNDSIIYDSKNRIKTIK